MATMEREEWGKDEIKSLKKLELPQEMHWCGEMFLTPTFTLISSPALG